MESEWQAYRDHRYSVDGKQPGGREASAASVGERIVHASAHEPAEASERDVCIAGLGDIAAIDSGLMEWNYGDYEGLTPKQIHERVPNWMISENGCPGGEQPEEVGTRIDRVIDKVRVPKGNVALFAHGHILRVFGARWLGLPAGAGRHFLLETASLNILSYYRGIPAIRRWNVTLSG